MKTISNRISLVIALSVIVTLLTASQSLAVLRPGPEACAKVEKFQSTTLTAVTNNIANMNNNFTSRLTELSNKETSVDTRVAKDRDTRDADFESKIKKLETEFSSSSTKIQAIATFKTNMKAAETTRRAKVDDARSLYRQTLMSDITNHQATLTAASTTLKNTISEAINTALKNCSTDSATTPDLSDSIRTARDNFTAVRQAEKTSANIKQLTETRNASIKAANDEFQTLVKSYKETLTTALKTNN